MGRGRPAVLPQGQALPNPAVKPRRLIVSVEFSDEAQIEALDRLATLEGNSRAAIIRTIVLRHLRAEGLWNPFPK